MLSVIWVDSLEAKQYLFNLTKVSGYQQKALKIWLRILFLIRIYVIENQISGNNI